MNYLLKCTFIAIGFCTIVSMVSSAAIAQNDSQPFTGNGQRSVNQTRDEIAALPASPDVAPQRSANSASGASSQPYSTFYRQASAQADVYNYPATGPPRVASGLNSNFSLFRKNAIARPTNQMSVGSNTSTGNLGPRIQNYSQTPIYNMNPYAGQVSLSTRNTGSRSPVEQQRSSTMSQAQSFSAQTTQFTTAQQAQAQAIQLARLAQIQQAQVQQTLAQAQQAQARASQIAQLSPPATAYRQAVYQQPTLGLGGPQARTAQNQVPGQPVFIQPTVPQGSQACCRPNYQLHPGLATFNSPSAYAPTLKLQNMPIGTYYGQGIIGQPTAYVDGQPVRNLLRYISP